MVLLLVWMIAGVIRFLVGCLIADLFLLTAQGAVLVAPIDVIEVVPNNDYISYNYNM